MINWGWFVSIKMHGSIPKKLCLHKQVGQARLGPWAIVCLALENCLEHIKCHKSVSYQYICASSRTWLSVHAYVYIHVCMGSIMSE